MPTNRKRMTRIEVLLRFAGVTALTFLLLVLASVSVMGAWKMYGKLSHATEQEEAALREFAALKSQEAQVEKSVSGIASERGLEAALRERYGVVRPGEGVIQVVETQNTAGNAATSTSNIFIKIFRTLFVW